MDETIPPGQASMKTLIQIEELLLAGLSYYFFLKLGYAWWWFFLIHTWA